MKKFYGEKEIDKYIRNTFFPDYSYRGVFIEIGAAGPEFLSMSRHFRENGWRVVGIEPNPEFCRQHREKGFEILQYACGDHDEDNVEFFVVNAEGAAYDGGKVSYESFSSLGFKSSYAEEMKDIKEIIDIINQIGINMKMKEIDILIIEANMIKIIISCF